MSLVVVALGSILILVIILIVCWSRASGRGDDFPLAPPDEPTALPHLSDIDFARFGAGLHHGAELGLPSGNMATGSSTMNYLARKSQDSPPDEELVVGHPVMSGSLHDHHAAHGNREGTGPATMPGGAPGGVRGQKRVGRFRGRGGNCSSFFNRDVANPSSRKNLHCLKEGSVLLVVV